MIASSPLTVRPVRSRRSNGCPAATTSPFSVMISMMRPLKVETISDMSFMARSSCSSSAIAREI